MQNKRYFVIASIISIVLFGIIGVVLFTTPNSLAVVESKEITFRYPNEYKQEPTENTNNDGGEQLLYVSRKNPEGIIQLTKAGSAEEGANALKISQLDFLEKNAELKFKVTYKDYEKISTERTKLSGFDSQIITFKYSSKDSQNTIFMKYIMILKSQNIYYINAQNTNLAQLKSDTDVILETLELQD